MLRLLFGVYLSVRVHRGSGGQARNACAAARDGFGNHENDTLTHYGLIMIDNLIGEYDCVTKVRYYDFQDLSQESQKEGLLPLSQLRAFIDKRK